MLRLPQARGEDTVAMQESTRKLIDTQTEVAKATAEAAKYLSEAQKLAAAQSAGATVGRKPKTTTTTKRRSNEAGENDDTESLGKNRPLKLSWFWMLVIEQKNTNVTLC